MAVLRRVAVTWGAAPVRREVSRDRDLLGRALAATDSTHPSPLPQLLRMLWEAFTGADIGQPRKPRSLSGSWR